MDSHRGANLAEGTRDRCCTIQVEDIASQIQNILAKDGPNERDPGRGVIVVNIIQCQCHRACEPHSSNIRTTSSLVDVGYTIVLPVMAADCVAQGLNTSLSPLAQQSRMHLIVA